MIATIEAEKYRFIHNFLPHPHHKTRAKLLSNKAVFTYSLLLVLILGLFNLIPKLMPGVLGYASNTSISELFSLTNKVRETAGLSDLKLNAELMTAAQNKAEDMFKDNYWAHVSPKGTQPWDFILAQHYDYSYAGENLAKNFNSSKEVVDAWYNSPSHRENLLNPKYEEIGFAVVNGVLDGYETTLVVQMFGKPRVPTTLASNNEEKQILENAAENKVSAPALQPAVNLTISKGSTLAAVDVSSVSKYIGLVFGGFIISLLALDIWYSRRRSIPKFTGHTFAHLTLLVVALLGIWFVLAPGKIL